MKKILTKFSLVLALFASSAFAGEQQEYDYRITAILPLSGEKAVVGKNMLGAMKLALKDLKADNFELKAIDSEFPSESILSILDQQKPNAIIGPAYSNDVRKIIPGLARLNTCVISFSNDYELANHNCLALMGFMPEESVKAVTNYAKQNGYEVLALLPDNKYGRIIDQQLVDNQKTGKRPIIQSKFYNPDDDYALISALDELNIAIGNNSKPALLIPDSSVLPKILSKLDSRVKLLGSSQMEDEKLYSIPQMQHAWYASAPKKYREKFERHFQVNFDAKPLKISALAYDATAFAYTIVNSSESKMVTKAQLSDPLGFIGITGYFRFNQDGTNIRDLAIFEINNGQATEVKGAGNI